MVRNSRAPRRILHTSDVHLQSLGGKECYSLEAVVDLAISAGVDMVIIAGDLFEHNRVEDDVISFAAKQLKRLPMPAVILPGNHDCLIPGSVYHRMKLWDGATNVHVFRTPQGETLDLPELGVSIWGKPIDAHDATIQPLEGVPRPQGKGYWHIAVAHGYYAGPKSRPVSGFRITKEQIAMSGQDYVALGHWANFMCVCDKPVCAYYCDSPSWTFPNSTVNIVNFSDEEGVLVTQWPLKDV